MDRHVNNYAKQTEHARLEFLKHDQEQMIRRFGLPYDDRSLYVTFFQRRYGISRETGEVVCCADSAPAGFNAVMSIYDMLCYSKSAAALSGDWRTLASLSPHSNFGVSGRSMFGQAAKRYSGMLERLKKACAELGGRETTKADAGYVFDAFPFLPIIFQFWDGDDEFEPRISFLFDSNTLDYIHFETAWYVAGHLLDRIDLQLFGTAEQD